mmetsp:Transcript_33442/g.83505  ORF Transcript_33442/g.83505 Transcript_33442/m.83505 type:complete len:279 (+) Transcript_33442:763-1599(+)
MGAEELGAVAAAARREAPILRAHVARRDRVVRIPLLGGDDEERHERQLPAVHEQQRAQHRRRQAVEVYDGADDRRGLEEGAAADRVHEARDLREARLDEQRRAHVPAHGAREEAAHFPVAGPQHALRQLVLECAEPAGLRRAAARAAQVELHDPVGRVVRRARLAEIVRSAIAGEDSHGEVEGQAEEDDGAHLNELKDADGGGEPGVERTHTLLHDVRVMRAPEQRFRREARQRAERLEQRRVLRAQVLVERTKLGVSPPALDLLLADLHVDGVSREE